MAQFNLIGIVALVLGIIFLIAPFFGLTAIGILSGGILAGLGLWMVRNALKERKKNQFTTWLLLIFALISLGLGVAMIFQIFSINYLRGVYLYVTGILIFTAGILVLTASQESNYKKYSGIAFITLGLLYLLVAAMKWDPIYISIIIGLILIIYAIITLRIGRSS